MVKYELHLYMRDAWLETRIRPGKGNASGKIVAITWAANVASRLVREGVTEAVLRLVTAKSDKPIWNLTDFCKIDMDNLPNQMKREVDDIWWKDQGK